MSYDRAAKEKLLIGQSLYMVRFKTVLSEIVVYVVRFKTVLSEIVVHVVRFKTVLSEIVVHTKSSSVVHMCAL